MAGRTDIETGSRWLHRKSRGRYEILGTGPLIADRPVADDEEVVVAWDATDPLLVAVHAMHRPTPMGSRTVAARMQGATPVAPGTRMVVYRAESGGDVWTRPAAEFADGRFEWLAGGRMGKGGLGSVR